MESFFSRFKNPLALIAILLVQTIALATQVRRPEDAAGPDAAGVRLIRLWALAVISPVERLSTGTGHGVRAAWTDYLDLRHVRRQNQSLQQQMATMRLERAALAEDALEGQRLRTTLAFQQNYVSSTVVAQVIGTSGTDQSRLLTLDKGARDGLKPDMAVITPDGVVGKLRDVFPATSQLLLLDDPSAGAGVILQSTRIRAVIRGTPRGELVINNLTADARIQPGEKVLTSGGDQVFPRGLPVGTIASIQPDPDHQPYTAIAIRPAADLNRLEEVMIITGTAAGLDAQAQQELVTDAANHAQMRDQLRDQMRAADLSAERLPSLHDDKPADASTEPAAELSTDLAKASGTPPADNARDLVPRPRPALHPDRYSPGSVPPAAELTPGSPRPRNATPQPQTQTKPQTQPQTKPQPQPQPQPQPTEPKDR